MQFQLTEGRKGFPTVQVKIEGRNQTIHSKYDPIREANQLIDKYVEKIEKEEHVFFYGVGLGYHIIEFSKRYPNKLITIYEPFQKMNTLKNEVASQTGFHNVLLHHAIVEETAEDGKEKLRAFASDLSHSLTLIVHPMYEQIFSDKLEQFLVNFKEFIVERKININTGKVFGKRWSANVIKNIKHTLETPNFILDFKEQFRGKPVILAAAGPSLSEEIENLREVKERGLAYIFAVGSANKELIAKGIKPDAVFSYDPQQHNYRVFEPILEAGYEDIPLIYGTSVGYETVEYWAGPKMHFITSQDQLTPSLTTRELPVINDAYSIAIVTMQILAQLHVKQIVLVGQNFAFKNNQFYAESVKRFDLTKKKRTDSSVQERDLVDAFFVESVDGQKVKTNDSFNRMRLLMEEYIAAISHISIVNTTQGGAKIAGTTFMTLRSLINDWTEHVVLPNWYEKKQVTSLFDTQTKKQLKKIDKELVQYPEQLRRGIKYFRSLLQKKYRTENQIQKELQKIDNTTKSITETEIFTKVIRNRIVDIFKAVQVEINIVQLLPNNAEKIQRIARLFIEFTQEIQLAFNELAPLIEKDILNLFYEHKEVYTAASGFIHYEKEWNKYFHPRDLIPEGTTEEETFQLRRYYNKIGRVIPATTSVYTEQVEATAHFQITNGTFEVYGRNLSEHAIQIQITVGEFKRKLTIRPNKIEKENYQPSIKLYTHTQWISETREDIKIELLSEGVFQLDSIHISNGARVWHVDEVEHVDELKNGKRIRGHYKNLKYNKIGDISHFAVSPSHFIQEDLGMMHQGDFYWIVINDTGKETILLTDRVLQTQVSYERIMDGIKDTPKVYLLDKDEQIELLNSNDQNASIGVWITNKELQSFLSYPFIYKYQKYETDQLFRKVKSNLCNEAVGYRPLSSMEVMQ